MHGPLVRASEPRQAWPALPGLGYTHFLAFQQQLAETQWWPSESIDRAQRQQLTALLRHAATTVPFYESRLDIGQLIVNGELDEAAWRAVPPLTRAEVQAGAHALTSAALPLDHGSIRQVQTTGSTSQPLQVRGSDINRFLNQALLLREHLWHQRDLRAKLANITTLTKDGNADYWSFTLGQTFENGPCVRKQPRVGVPELVRWLVRERPTYLLTHASLAVALAQHCITETIEVPGLREVRTFSEVLPAQARDVCREAWNATIVDNYSSTEVGPIALQCPDTKNYHLQSECLRVEVIRSDGTPCSAGEIGRVLVTPLHNFAMPLIRYDLGDYAEAGPPCSCGRTLPVLRRIMGRARNMIRTPDGRDIWPSVPAGVWLPLPIKEFQLVQDRIEHFDVYLIAEGTLSEEQEAGLTERLCNALDYRFELTYRYVDSIPRTGYKREDVISLVTNR